MEEIPIKYLIKRKFDQIGSGFYKEVILNNESVDILLYIVEGRIILSRCINKTTTNNYEWTMLHLLLNILVQKKEIFHYQQVEILKKSKLYTENDCLSINSDCNLVKLGFKENTVSTTCENLIDSLKQMKQVSETLSGGSKKSRKYKRKSRKVYKSRRVRCNAYRSKY
jgi:hypothetical protein